MKIDPIIFFIIDSLKISFIFTTHYGLYCAHFRIVRLGKSKISLTRELCDFRLFSALLVWKLTFHTLIQATLVNWLVTRLPWQWLTHTSLQHGRSSFVMSELHAKAAGDSNIFPLGS